MKRIFSVLCVAGSASLLSLAGSTSWAQSTGALDAEAAAVKTRLELVEWLEEGLRFAEAARLRGECASVEHASSKFYGMHMQILPPEVASDLRRRMKEIAERPCPPVETTPPTALPMTTPAPPPAGPDRPDVTAPPVSQPPAPVGSTGNPAPVPTLPPISIDLPPVPDSGGIDDCPGGTLPDETGECSETTPEGHEPILDEIGSDIGATKSGLPVKPAADPPRTTPPPPRTPEETHVLPKPVGSASGSLLPARGDILDGMAPLRAALEAAIAECDQVAFKATKNQLLEAIGQLLTRFPGNIHLLAERRRIEETQLPRPCPPDGR